MNIVHLVEQELERHHATGQDTEWLHPEHTADAVLGYIDALMWSTVGDDGEPLDATLSRADLAPDAVTSIVTDVVSFLVSAGQDKVSAYLRHDRASRGWDCIGHDFLLTRDGHGTGFWDRGMDTLGHELADLARPFGESDAYVGDGCGRVHVSPARDNSDMPAGDPSGTSAGTEDYARGVAQGWDAANYADAYGASDVDVPHPDERPDAYWQGFLIGHARYHFGMSPTGADDVRDPDSEVIAVAYFNEKGHSPFLLCTSDAQLVHGYTAIRITRTDPRIITDTPED